MRLSSAALDTAAQEYISDHYKEGVASVFVPTSGKVTIQLVANRYNPQNFWSGRWRSRYDIDLDAKTVTSKILVTVHYYEQGNVTMGFYARRTLLILGQVQLTTEFTPTLTLPSSSPSPQAARQLLAQIMEQENTYQTSLSDTYHDLGEKRFKTLRRALPITRNKIDWDKVFNTRLFGRFDSHVIRSRATSLERSLVRAAAGLDHSVRDR